MRESGENVKLRKKLRENHGETECKRDWKRKKKRES